MTSGQVIRLVQPMNDAIKAAYNTLFGSVQRASGTVMILSGVVLPLTIPGSPYGQSLSGVLAALGGALWSSIDSDEIARRRLSPRITPIARHLVNSINQLVGILNQVEGKELEEPEGLRHVSEIIPGLRTIVTDLAQLTGEQFDPAFHNETIAKMTEMITALETRTDAGIPSVLQTDDALKVLREVRGSLQSLGPQSLLRTEEVSCPACNASQRISIAVEPVSSATPTCRSCGVTFHAHRKHDLSVFAKLPGKSMLQQPAHRVTCDTCGFEFPTRLPQPGTTIDRFCVRCGRNLEFDSSGKITKSSEAPLTESDATPDEHQRGILHCPTHNSNAQYFYEDQEGARYACCVAETAAKHLVKHSNTTVPSIVPAT